MSVSEDYQLMTGYSDRLEKCPLCCYQTDIYRIVSVYGDHQKIVCCSRPFDEETELLGGLEICPMFNPAPELRKLTIREATQAWNKMAKAFRKLQGRE